jgi:hypothetical protein
MKTSSLNRFSLATLALFAVGVALHPTPGEARPGVRGAAPTSISRPAGGGGARGGQFAGHGGGQFQGANTGQRTNASAQVNQGQRFSGNSQVNGGNRAVANNSGNRTVNNNGNRAVNNGNINTGNINVANGNNVNVNVNNDHGWGYWNDNYHPVAAGVAVGTAAAVTSAAIGSMMYSLPPACSPRPYGGMTYYYCGGAWYAPQYQGDQVVYVVVNQPG